MRSGVTGRRMVSLGGGVILYLAQEGRGLALANKMRTYRLQDGGLDIFDANTTLDFDDDERDYGVAARMLQILNCSRILLLTNIPPSWMVSHRLALRSLAASRWRRRSILTTSAI